MDLHEGTHLGLCLPISNNNLEGTDTRVSLFPVAHCILSFDETRPPLHWSKSNRKPRALSGEKHLLLRRPINLKLSLELSGLEHLGLFTGSAQISGFQKVSYPILLQKDVFLVWSSE